MTWTKTKITIGTTTAVILAIGTGIAVVNKMHSSWAAQLPPDGIPRTPEQLNTWYVEPPAGQNAALFELRGIKARQINGASQNPNLPFLGNLPPPAPTAPLPPAVKSAMTDFVQNNRDALKYFAQGAQCQESRYPIDLSKGANTLLPHLAEIKSGTYIAEAAAILDSDNNDESQAAADVLTALGLARSLKAEPVLISQLVRAASASLSVDALNQVINRTTLSPASLNELSNSFQEMEEYDVSGEGFTRALAGEKVMYSALLKTPKELIRVSGLRHRIGEYVRKPAKLKAEQAYLETTFQQIKSARQADFPERLTDVADAVHERVAEAKKEGLLVNVMFWDGYDKSVIREARCRVVLRYARTAVALEQFRAAHGRYPGTLSELTPTYLDTVPADPFDGQALRYRQHGNGYVLYSIGPDHEWENGGNPISGKAADVVFSVGSP